MFSQNRSEMESKLSRIVLWIYSPPRKMQGSKRLLALQGEITSELTQHISYDLCYDGIWSRNRFFFVLWCHRLVHFTWCKVGSAQSWGTQAPVKDQAYIGFLLKVQVQQKCDMAAQQRLASQQNLCFLAPNELLPTGSGSSI